MERILSEFDYALAMGWVFGRAALVILLLLLAALLRSALRRVIPRLIKAAVLKSASSDGNDELTKRYSTLSSVALRTASAVIWVVVAFETLSLLGIDITPILAGVGVAGIAIGFGAQSLVKDILAGVFILLENQYAKGDVVTVAGVSGYVEDVNLRRTVLRDQDGTVHNIPNGEVRIASNLTRDWSRVNLNVSIAYGEDVDRVFAIINGVGEALAADVTFGSAITEPPRALRVEGLEESGLSIKILGVTKPMRQWEVTGELRRRLNKAFEEEGIEIAYPRRVIVHRSDPPGQAGTAALTEAKGKATNRLS